VLSRHNHAGFYYTGTAANDEGGQAGQLVCYNCIAVDNTRGGDKCGFKIDGSENKMTLFSCKSINNSIGFIASKGSGLELYDCSSYGCTTEKSGDGTFTIINTEITN
jgi:hypothetical protein